MQEVTFGVNPGVGLGESGQKTDYGAFAYVFETTAEAESPKDCYFEVTPNKQIIVLKEGYLEKKSTGLFECYRKRYIVVTSDSTDKFLSGNAIPPAMRPSETAHATRQNTL